VIVEFKSGALIFQQLNTKHKSFSVYKSFKLPAMFLKTILIVASIGSMLYYRPWQDAAEQAQRAHGFELPSSAEHVHTVGDWRVFLLDKGASTTFTMQKSEMNAFISHLVDDKSFESTGFSANTGIPINAIYHQGLPKPWGAKTNPDQSRGFKSKAGILNWISMGDWVHMDVYETTTTELAVHIYTDWN